MNEEKKKHYEQLKIKAQNTEREKIWEQNVLLQEFLEILGHNKIILSKNKQEEVISKFNKLAKENTNVMNAIGYEITCFEKKICEWKESSIYIIWDEERLPVIQTDLKSIKGFKDDMVAVAFETWITSLELTHFMKFDHNGKIIEIIIE